MIWGKATDAKWVSSSPLLSTVHRTRRAPAVILWLRGLAGQQLPWLSAQCLPPGISGENISQKESCDWLIRNEWERRHHIPWWCIMEEMWLKWIWNSRTKASGLGPVPQEPLEANPGFVLSQWLQIIVWVHDPVASFPWSCCLGNRRETLWVFWSATMGEKRKDWIRVRELTQNSQQLHKLLLSVRGLRTGKENHHDSFTETPWWMLP